jgi:uncharacterized protein with FMN-binding domain
MIERQQTPVMLTENRDENGRPIYPPRTINGMRKGSGKGRISNNLVAVSCAAVLTVYAAGYWRTRDAARQFAAQAKGRRSAARTERAAVSPKPAVIEPSAPAPLPPPEAPTTIAPAVVAKAAGPSSPVAAQKAAPARAHAHPRASTTTGAAIATAAPPSSPVPAPEAMSAPASVGHGLVVEPVTVTEPIPTPPPAPRPPATPAARWRDGIYTGHGDSPHGDLDVRVVIRDGRIVEAAIQNCNTRYPCELIDPMVQQSVVIQSSNVDYVSRATESSEAYNDGLVEALNKALYPAPGKETASQ